MLGFFFGGKDLSFYLIDEAFDINRSGIGSHNE